MKLIIQRVKKAKVEVACEVVGRIGAGMLVFLGIGKEDTATEADELIKKILHLRIFSDAQGKMNRSALDVGAEFLVVSQFTLYGDCQKGRCPSFDQAAAPQEAEPLYHYFVTQLKKHGVRVATGVFGAMMEVSLVNDGPVTFIL